MNIALCDDDEEFTGEMEAMLSPYIFRKEREIHLEKYTDAELLINDVKSGRSFDVYMLDVEIASVNGIDAAKEIIKAAQSDPYIIFISNYPQYMQNSFAVHPYQYIQKPVNQIKLYTVLDEILEKEKKHRLDMTLLDTGDDVQIPVNIMDIMWIETVNARRHTVKFHFFDRSVSARGTISEWEESLRDYPFFQCYRGILVNIYNVHYIQGSEVLMKNGDKIPVSRKNINRMKSSMVNVVNTYVL